jgi:hypothetical protein
MIMIMMRDGWEMCRGVKGRERQLCDIADISKQSKNL